MIWSNRCFWKSLRSSGKQDVLGGQGDTKEFVRTEPRRRDQGKAFLYAFHSDFLIKLYAKGKDVKNACLITEFACRGDLKLTRSRSHEGYLPEIKARKVLSQVLLGLEYLHACNVIYRDLKPANALFFAGGRMDFFLTISGFPFKRAIKLQDIAGLASVWRRRYLYDGDAYNDAVDWWTFGVMLFDLIYGGHPHCGYANESPREYDIVNGEIH